MSKKKTDATVTDSEILSYSNVPVNIAAQYLGVSPESVRDSLQGKSAPYGYFTQKEDSNRGMYHISPGLLVAYQTGKLQAWDTIWLVEQIAAEVERVVEKRYKHSLELLCSKLLDE